MSREGIIFFFSRKHFEFFQFLLVAYMICILFLRVFSFLLHLSHSDMVSFCDHILSVMCRASVHPSVNNFFNVKVKGTRTFSTKKFDNLAMLGDRTLKLRRDVCPHQ